MPSPKPTAEKTPDSRRLERLRRLVFWAVVLHSVGIGFFVVMLLVGERTRFTMLAVYFPRIVFLASTLVAAAGAWFSRRRVRLAVAFHIGLLLVLLFPVLGFSVGHARTPATAHRIRLASYNVYFGKLGRKEVLDEIEAMDADIVVLQATWDSVGAMKERFPDRSTHRADDFVLLTRFKILRVEEPPPLADGELPKYVGYTLETPGGPIRIYNVHPFSPRHALFGGTDSDENAEHREAQIEAAVWAAKNPGPPFVIVGDTNLPPGSAIARRQLEGLVDAFDVAGFGLGYTFPAKRPWMRIDRAFAGPGIRFLDVRAGARGASDHRPLFVDLELDRGRDGP